MYAGHYYELVSNIGASTSNSIFASVALRSYLLMPGHLASIVGIGEQKFIAAIVNNMSTPSATVLIDGQRAAGSTTFTYASKPESGLNFTFTNWNAATVQPGDAVSGLD